MRGQPLRPPTHDAARTSLNHELAQLRAELGEREEELAKLHLVLRTHNQADDRAGELGEAHRLLQTRLAQAEAESEVLAEELARERRRRASATLLARLSETAARTYEHEVSRLEQDLGQSRLELDRLTEALASSQQDHEHSSQRAEAELRALRQERDCALTWAEATLQLRRLDEFAAWFLQPRVAAGLLRRGKTGARAALTSFVEAKDLRGLTSPGALDRLARPRTIMLLLARAMISGSDRGREAVRFRLTHSGG